MFPNPYRLHRRCHRPRRVRCDWPTESLDGRGAMAGESPDCASCGNRRGGVCFLTVAGGVLLPRVLRGTSASSPFADGESDEAACVGVRSSFVRLMTGRWYSFRMSRRRVRSKYWPRSSSRNPFGSSSRFRMRSDSFNEYLVQSLRENRPGGTLSMISVRPLCFATSCSTSFQVLPR